MSTVYEELVTRDELVYAEKCSFMEALLILRYVCVILLNTINTISSITTNYEYLYA